MKKTGGEYEVIVVGGGASGMMASGRAAECGKKVLLLEKNPTLGEKLKISGGGRCNITNAEYNKHLFLKNYGEAEQFLYSPFSEFGVQETFNFFETRGLPLVIQARKHAFPETEKAFDVFKVLEKYLREGGVAVKTSATVTGIVAVSKIIRAVRCGAKEYRAKSFIFATGGISHPETGSTGDGFKWLDKLGHKISKPAPMIVPLAVKDKWVKVLSGTSLSFMKITFYLEGKKQFSRTGKILFTHFGLSGPLILNCAGKIGDLLHSGEVTAKIDAFPDSDLGMLDKKITKIFDENKNKMLKNIFENIAPVGTGGSILWLAKTFVGGETKVHSVTKEQRKKIAELMKNLPLSVTGLMGYDRAVVTGGGVPLSEIDTKTMRSKVVENLWVTGDLLHIRRPSGGFSLQLCWTTGFVAGSNA